jgi:hypothetical protein
MADLFALVLQFKKMESTLCVLQYKWLYSTIDKPFLYLFSGQHIYPYSNFFKWFIK